MGLLPDWIGGILGLSDPVRISEHHPPPGDILVQVDKEMSRQIRLVDPQGRTIRTVEDHSIDTERYQRAAVQRALERQKVERERAHRAMVERLREADPEPVEDGSDGTQRPQGPQPPDAKKRGVHRWT